jgi:hypothetical protein
MTPLDWPLKELKMKTSFIEQSRVVSLDHARERRKLHLHVERLQDHYKAMSFTDLMEETDSLIEDLHTLPLSDDLSLRSQCCLRELQSRCPSSMKS